MTKGQRSTHRLPRAKGECFRDGRDWTAAAMRNRGGEPRLGEWDFYSQDEPATKLRTGGKSESELPKGRNDPPGLMPDQPGNVQSLLPLGPGEEGQVDEIAIWAW